MILVAAAVLRAAQPFAHEAVALVEGDGAGVVRKDAEDGAPVPGRRRPVERRLEDRAADAHAAAAGGHRHAEPGDVRRGRVGVGPQPEVTRDAPGTSATRNRPRGERSDIGDAPSPVARRASPGRRTSVTCGSAATASSIRVTRGRVALARVAHARARARRRASPRISVPAWPRAAPSPGEREAPARARLAAARTGARRRRSVYFSSRRSPLSSMAACAAARRAIGTRNGEQLT